MSRTRSGVLLAIVILSSLWTASCGSKPTAPDWSQAIPPTSANLRSVAYGGGLFVAAGETSAVFTSNDGVTWQSEVLPDGVRSFVQVSFDGTQFLAISEIPGKLPPPPSPAYVAAPERPLKWVPRATVPVQVVSVAGVQVRTSLTHVETSTDGVTWVAAPITAPAIGLAAGNGRVVVLGLDIAPKGPPSTSGYVTTDGVTWTQHGIADGGGHLLFVEGQFVVVADSDRAYIGASTDGASWTSLVDVDAGKLEALQKAGDRYFALGRGAVLSSTDTREWASENANTKAQLWAVAGGGGRYVAVGDSGTIIYRSAP